MFPYQTIIRIRRRLVEDEMSGQPTLSDWENADEAEIDRVLFSPGTSDEFPQVHLEAREALAVIYLPLGADVRSGDRVRVDGALWAVEGRRNDWPGIEPIGGSVVNLRLIREEGNH